MELKNKKIVVVGLARTGVPVARFLAGREARVTVTDLRTADQLAAELAQLEGVPVELVLGGHPEEIFTGADLVVLSPGVPMEIPPVAAALRQGIAVIGEIELAARFIEAPMVAITGTNGKTTTTTVTGAIFRAAGYRTFVGGNIGDPLIDLALSGERVERVVAEISSFQLEGIDTFRPKVAALLNITEDHLDRYRSYDDYIAAKLRIFENQTASDFAVLNADDPLVVERTAGIGSRKFFFSRFRELEEGVFWGSDGIVFRLEGRELKISPQRFTLHGEHNRENMLCALGCTLLLDADPAKAQATLENFPALRHRMELVRELRGVRWYEDSKGTNVGSVVRSLESFPRPITLIAGGKDKGGSYEPLAPLVRERVAYLLLIGEAKGRMAEALGSLTDTRFCDTLEEAVASAHELTPAGGVVLFSPACSSFDMFRDYEERAECFTAAVKALPEER